MYQGHAPHPPAPEEQPETQSPRPLPAEQAPVVAALGEGAAAPADGDTVTVDTDLIRARFTAAGARLTSLELKRYRHTVAADSEPLELVGSGMPVDGGQPMGPGAARLLPLTLKVGTGPLDAGVAYRPDRSALMLQGDERGAVVFTAERGDGTTITKRYEFSGNSYLFDVDVSASQSSPQLGLVLTSMPTDPGRSTRPEVALAL